MGEEVLFYGCGGEGGRGRDEDFDDDEGGGCAGYAEAAVGFGDLGVVSIGEGWYMRV